MTREQAEQRFCDKVHRQRQTCESLEARAKEAREVLEQVLASKEDHIDYAMAIP